jgi:hypothetical protein
VVHLRLQGQKGEFGAWREQYVPFLSKATVYRYLAVAEIDQEAIGKDEGITDLYRRFLILPTKPPVEPVSATASAVKVFQPDSPIDEPTTFVVPTPAEEIGMAPPVKAEPTVSRDIQSQDEDTTPEEDEDLRDMELTAALVVIGEKAKLHNVESDPKTLLGFLAEFGVTPSDIAALTAA